MRTPRRPSCTPGRHCRVAGDRREGGRERQQPGFRAPPHQAERAAKYDNLHINGSVYLWRQRWLRYSAPVRAAAAIFSAGPITWRRLGWASFGAGRGRLRYHLLRPPLAPEASPGAQLAGPLPRAAARHRPAPRDQYTPAVRPEVVEWTATESISPPGGGACVWARDTQRLIICEVTGMWAEGGERERERDSARGERDLSSSASVRHQQGGGRDIMKRY